MNQIYAPSCDICKDVIYCLGRYPELFKPQENYRMNVYQECLLNYISGVLNQCKPCPDSEMLTKMKDAIASAEEVWEKAVLKQEEFCESGSCDIKKVINEDLIKIRDILVEEKQIGFLNWYYVERVCNLNLPRCSKCWACLDFIFNLDIVTKLLCGEMKINDAKIAIANNKCIDNTDRVIALAHVSPVSEFNILKSYERSGKKLVYLDSNIFMNLERPKEKNGLKNAIKNSKNWYDYYYSPSHLEDILKRDISVAPILSVIEEITEGLFIHRFEDKVRLDYEKPESSFKRTDNQHSKQITELVEDNYIERFKMRELTFPQYQTEEHKRRINDKDLFGCDKALLEDVLEHISIGFSLDDIKNLNIEKVKYVELNDIIYNLIKAMNILNFWYDAEKVRSSLHDIEHLIYAAYSDIFVTDDKRLLHRSEAILGYLLPNIQIMNLKKFQQIILKGRL